VRSIGESTPEVHLELIARLDLKLWSTTNDWVEISRSRARLNTGVWLGGPPAGLWNTLQRDAVGAVLAFVTVPASLITHRTHVEDGPVTTGEHEVARTLEAPLIELVRIGGARGTRCMQ